MLVLAHLAGTFAPLQLVPALAGAAAYFMRARTLAERSAPVPAWRQWCWYGSLALIAFTLASPIGHISDELFAVHMVEHLLIADIAALLLVLGLTGPLLQPLLSIPVLDRLRALANPAIAFPLWAVDLYLWHLPALYQDAYGGAALHSLEHTMFIFFGCLMWMPLVGPLPKPSWFTNAWKLGYVVAVRFTGVVLGNVMMWSGKVLYPVYAKGETDWDISPLADQSTAGVIMMIEGTLVTLGVFAWLFFRTAEEGSERQRLLELAEARGVPLDEARAARAVASGQGKRLEERLLAGDGENG